MTGTRQAGRRRSIAPPALGLLVAAAVLVLMVLLSIWVGTRHLPVTAVWRLLWHDDGSPEAVVVAQRIPRTLLGLAVGAALGLAGAVLQALTRNPLADPGLLGITTGAATAVVLAIAYLQVTAVTGYVWFAFAGAAAVAVLVYLLGATGRAGATSPDRLVLAGAAINAVLLAVSSAVLLLDPQAFNQFRFWDVGSLAGRQLDVLTGLAPFLIAGGLLALALARPLNALALGTESATALGVRVGRVRGLAAIAGTLLCGAATAAAGPIGFVGLTVPHAARLIVGPDHRWVLPYSMLLAPILLLGSDVLGRVVAAPAEVPVGVVTAVIGAPVFIALCRRRKLAEL